MTQIQLAHEGHQGQDKTLQPAGDEVDCLAAQTRAETEPLRPTEFPDGPWQEQNSDWKERIGIYTISLTSIASS